MFAVNHWGSHPDAGNDDCFTGQDFDTLEAAKASPMYLSAEYDVPFIELDGPGVHEVRRNPDFSAKEVAFDYALEQSERAMQAGMAFGVQGFNDEMGYDSE